MKINTICENGAFLRAYRKGKKSAGRYVVVYSLPTRPSDIPPRGGARLGLTVTKGRGGAVVRNRIKRVLRAAWRRVTEEYPAASGVDVIIVARDAAAFASSNDIVPELFSALSRLGVISPGCGE